MRTLLLALSLVAVSTFTAFAQNPTQSIGSSLQISVFPADGQAADQQSKDEAECYQWAVGNTGVDPFELEKQAAAAEQQTEQQVQQAKSATQGSAVRGAVRGAAGGALIGEIHDGDSSKGAQTGAAVGAVASRSRSKRASRQAQEQAKQQGAAQQQDIQAKTENFKNAFGVCLEAKEYMVKH